MNTPLRGLYLITPDEADTARLLARVAPLLGAGVALLQYRNKAAGAALKLYYAQNAAAMLRAVGNEHRLLILCLLIEHGEMTVGALLEDVALSQSALSQHLARMREDGLVAYRRESQTLHYRIENPDVAKLIATLKTLFCP